MRTAALAVLCLAFLGCKKSPQPTVTRIPDSNIGPGGGTFETPEAVMFHTVYRYSGHSGQALAFYAPEMEKRGATRSGDGYADDNVVHTGGIGKDRTPPPQESHTPGGVPFRMETPESTPI